MNQNTNYKLRDFLKPTIGEAALMIVEVPFASIPILATINNPLMALAPQIATYLGVRAYELFGRDQEKKAVLRLSKRIWNWHGADKHGNYCSCNDCKAIVESELELKAKAETAKADEKIESQRETVNVDRETVKKPQIIFDEPDESKTNLRSPYFTEEGE